TGAGGAGRRAGRARARARPPGLVRAGAAWRGLRPARPASTRSGSAGASASLSRIDATAFGGVLIEADEVPQGHRIRDVFGFGERVEAERLFETRDENRDRERVEARVEQHEVVGQRRQRLLVALGDLLNSRDD